MESLEASQNQNHHDLAHPQEEDEVDEDFSIVIKVEVHSNDVLEETQSPITDSLPKSRQSHREIQEEDGTLHNNGESIDLQPRRSSRKRKLVEKHVTIKSAFDVHDKDEVPAKKGRGKSKKQLHVSPSPPKTSKITPKERNPKKISKVDPFFTKISNLEQKNGKYLVVKLLRCDNPALSVSPLKKNLSTRNKTKKSTEKTEQSRKRKQQRIGPITRRPYKKKKKVLESKEDDNDGLAEISESWLTTSVFPLIPPLPSSPPPTLPVTGIGPVMKTKRFRRRTKTDEEKRAKALERHRLWRLKKKLEKIEQKEKTQAKSTGNFSNKNEDKLKTKLQNENVHVESEAKYKDADNFESPASPLPPLVLSLPPPTSPTPEPVEAQPQSPPPPSSSPPPEASPTQTSQSQTQPEPSCDVEIFPVQNGIGIPQPLRLPKRFAGRVRRPELKDKPPPSSIDRRRYVQSVRYHFRIQLQKEITLKEALNDTTHYKIPTLYGTPFQDLSKEEQEIVLGVCERHGTRLKIEGEWTQIIAQRRKEKRNEIKEKHERLQGSPVSIICPVIECKITCKGLPGVKNHLKLHFNSKGRDYNVKCKFCGALLSSHYAMFDHYKNIHLDVKDEDAMCNICGKVLSSKSRLKRHQYVHWSEEELIRKDVGVVCPTCGKVIVKRMLKDHEIQVHGKAGQYLCSVCGAVKNRKTALYEHWLTHFGPEEREKFEEERRKEKAFARMQLIPKKEKALAKMQLIPKKQKSISIPPVEVKVGNNVGIGPVTKTKRFRRRTKTDEKKRAKKLERDRLWRLKKKLEKIEQKEKTPSSSPPPTLPVTTTKRFRRRTKTDEEKRAKNLERGRLWRLKKKLEKMGQREETHEKSGNFSNENEDELKTQLQNENVHVESEAKYNDADDFESPQSPASPLSPPPLLEDWDNNVDDDDDEHPPENQVPPKIIVAKVEQEVELANEDLDVNVRLENSEEISKIVEDGIGTIIRIIPLDNLDQFEIQENEDAEVKSEVDFDNDNNVAGFNSSEDISPDSEEPTPSPIQIPPSPVQNPKDNRLRPRSTRNCSTKSKTSQNEENNDSLEPDFDFNCPSDPDFDCPNDSDDEEYEPSIKRRLRRSTTAAAASTKKSLQLKNVTKQKSDSDSAPGAVILAEGEKRGRGRPRKYPKIDPALKLPRKIGRFKIIRTPEEIRQRLRAKNDRRNIRKRLKNRLRREKMLAAGLLLKKHRGPNKKKEPLVISPPVSPSPSPPVKQSKKKVRKVKRKTPPPENPIKTKKKRKTLTNRKELKEKQLKARNRSCKPLPIPLEDFRKAHSTHQVVCSTELLLKPEFNLPENEIALNIKRTAPSVGHGNFEKPYWTLVPVEGEDSSLQLRCICPACGKLFKDVLTLSSHKIRTHRLLCQSCTTCGRPLTNQYTKVLHQRYHSSSAQLQAEYEREIEEHGPPPPGLNDRLYKCKICPVSNPKLWIGWSLLLQHGNKAHPKAPYTCDICGRPLKQKNSMEFHVQTHMSVEERVAWWEEYKKRNPKGLRKGNWVETKINNNLEGRVSQNRGWKYMGTVNRRNMIGKKKKKREHSDVKWNAPAICSICGKVFKTIYLLRRHEQRWHSEEQQPLVHCPICGRPFADKYMLPKHVPTHFGEEERSKWEAWNGRWEEFLECERKGIDLPLHPKLLRVKKRERKPKVVKPKRKKGRPRKDES
ncbi:unnamed protein product [Orchesella dallaii]|uniref:C2H2-type domain-containing protein n=1 Tax=Orchesella dallaii TaxID=48710 RepID=A0ABP1PZK4_9HEXA